MGRLLADTTPLRESPAFRRLWLGSAVSAVGSQLTLVAVGLEVYRLTQDSFYVGLLGIFAVSRRLTSFPTRLREVGFCAPITDS